MAKTSRTSLVLIALTIVAAIASSAVILGGLHASQGVVSAPPAAKLPTGCVRPSGGYLIIASAYGYNNSVLEGAGPSKPWPVLNATQGQDVKITVCNIDTTQSHGFQVGTYFDSKIESIAPDQVLTVNFVASKSGTFPIYCAIFCSIHLFMEYGQLRVHPAPS